MSGEGTDESLLAAARGGDAEALETLLTRYQSRVYRFGMRMCGDPEDAKDVLQETLLAMARGVRDYRGSASLSTWLFTIARSFCIKKRRRSRFAPAATRSLDAGAGEVPQVPDPRPGPEENLAGRQVESVLAGAIAALEPKSREVMVLRDIEGLRAAEVAEVLGIGVDAVKSRLHRARLAVRKAVLPHLGMDGEDGAAPRAPAACPDVLTLFSRHLEGEISADLCAEMERHLEGCAHCRGACESLRRTLALCHGAPAPEVPAEVQAAVRDALRRAMAGTPPRS